MLSRYSVIHANCKRAAGALALITLLAAAPLHAAGTVSSCDEASLNAALTGGGTVTVACDGGIVFSTVKTIALDTSLDASGHTVTFFGNNATRIFTVNSGVHLTLRNLTISNAAGSAITNAGTLTLDHVVLSNNAGGSPGGAALFNNGGTLQAVSSLFYQNTLTGGNGTPCGTTGCTAGNGGSTRGGAIYSSGGALSLVDCTFSQNQVTGGNGGDAGGLIPPAGVRSAAGPGAVRDAGSESPDLTLTGGGRGGDGKGGAIYLNAGSLAIYSSTFSLNQAFNGIGGGPGGADGVSDGGAIFMAAGTLQGANDTISSNGAYLTGGIKSAGSAILSGMSFANNSGAFSGGGSLANSLFSNNFANCSGVVIDQGGNISSDASCNFTAGTSLNATDPMLGPLANNGGSTQTQALLAGSPAINAGVAGCPLIDQRHYSRSGACDSGAFEYGGAPPVTPSVNGFTPASGNAGTMVTITGTGFDSAQSVYFNLAAAVFTINSATQITATVPAGATTGPLRVTNAASLASSTASFYLCADTTGPGNSLSLAKSSGLHLSWSPGAGANNYRVQRCSGAGCSPQNIATPAAVAYDDSVLADAASYQYQILADTGCGLLP